MTTTTHEHVWTATIAEDDERAELWREAFGGLSVPILSPMLEALSLRGQGLAACYELDVRALGDEGKYRAAHALGHRFGVPIAAAYDELERTGLPLLADGLRVGTTCCDYLPADHVERPHDEALRDQLGAEVAELDAEAGDVELRLPHLDAFLLMGVLQIALKYPGVVGEPLRRAIKVTRLLQVATCPPGSARERVAMCGWTGR